MKKLTVVAAALLVLALAAPSYAGIDEGDWEVGLGGGWASTQSTTTYGLGLSLGYFLTPNMQIGGWLGYGYNEYDLEVRDEGDYLKMKNRSVYWDIAAFFTYYFEMDGEWMPYIGGFVGYETNEIKYDTEGYRITADRNGFKLGGYLGVKFFVAEKATIFIEYRLTWRNEDEWDIEDGYKFEDDALSHLIHFGVTVLF